MSTHTLPPKTSEEVAALPAGPAFGARETSDPITGRKTIIPVAPDVVASWHGADDPLSYVDSDGATWTVGQYADGSFFRSRSL